MNIPKGIEPLINLIVSRSLPAHSKLSEEETSKSRTFEIESQFEPIEKSQNGSLIIKIEKPTQEIFFEAFIDGVQRTVAWRYIETPNGAIVPIHIAHIGVLAIFRDKSGTLFMDPNLKANRMLLLGPFEGLRKLGMDIMEISRPSEEVILDTDDKTFGFPNRINEWIICDTTYKGTEKERETQTEGALIGNALFNEGLVRSRAQGRVATLRQRLEFAVLARVKRFYPNIWIMVDGPLFFIEKWRQRGAQILSKELGEINKELIEDKLLNRSVGIIKGQRLRPKHPEQIIKIDYQQRSLVIPLSQEVDIKGRGDTPDEEGIYGGVHFTWYTRLRGRMSPPYGLLGLIRVDIHRSSLPGLIRADALTKEDFMQYSPLIDTITWAIWRERWPAFSKLDDFKTACEPYPIWQLEKICKSILFPRRYLSYFGIG